MHTRRLVMEFLNILKYTYGKANHQAFCYILSVPKDVKLVIWDDFLLTDSEYNRPIKPCTKNASNRQQGTLIFTIIRPVF